MTSEKRTIQEYWTKHAPGINSPDTDTAVGAVQYYNAVDGRRYRLEPYVLPLIRSLESAGKTVLEVGCGLGTDSREFARQGANTVAIDLSISNALLSKTGLTTYGLQGETMNADAENLPLRDESFDIVYSWGVLHHTPDTQRAINELHRVLRPKGRAIVMLYHKGLAYYWIILRRGILSLGFLRERREKLVSKGYDNTPLSKMYAKKEVLGLFSKFSQTRVTCLNFGGIQENPRLKHLWALFKKFPALERKLGSFLIINAKKTDTVS